MGRRSRFTPAQKRDAVLAVLTKRKTVSEVCRELQVSETSFNRWREQALEAIDEAMKDKADQNKGDVDMERRLAEAERTIGRLALENELFGKSVEVADVRTRTALGRRWRAEAVAPVATIAKVLRVSRQSLYDTPVRPDGPRPPKKRSTPPPLPEGWQQLTLSPATVTLEEALHVLARRHPAAGYRKVCARARRAGFVVNRKKVARLLREWGFTRRAPRPHPKAQGRPFNVIAPNVLWQTDMTSVWCGEDGWAYFTAVIDCFDRSILGWTFTTRCRAKDLAPALEQAWATAWPHGPEPDEDIVVVCRHDNGTQFTSNHYRDIARGLGVKLSRTAYRHPDGNAFIERLYRTLKEECVWPNDFDSFNEALAAITAWVQDYNEHRPHDSLRDRTPAEARAAALTTLNSAA